MTSKNKKIMNAEDEKFVRVIGVKFTDSSRNRCRRKRMKERIEGRKGKEGRQ